VHPSLDANHARALVAGNVDVGAGKDDGMAERQDVRSPLRGHDARQPRRGQRVALLQPALVEELERLARAAELGARDRHPRRAILLPDVDHLHGGSL